MTRKLVLEGFGGPGGWGVAAALLGLNDVAFELDPAACATRRAAGLSAVRADVTQVSYKHLRGKVAGTVDSPECQSFSEAGLGAGKKVLDILADGIRDAFAGRPTRAARRREMARALRVAGWPGKNCPRSGGHVKMRRAGKTWTKTWVSRGDRITAAVRSASLVIEPARKIAECLPEWVALEQVPAVLPLWKVYAEELRKLGYHVWCGKINCADYGVPQTRIRAILIASRARRVSCPAPTHHDPKKGISLFREPWVSMADALGFGTAARPAPAVTSGGTATGGAQPFGHRSREALARAAAGEDWMLMPASRTRPNDRTIPRTPDEPSVTVAFGHARMVKVRTSFGQPSGERAGTHEIDPAERPAHTVTSKAKDWRVTTNSGNGYAHDYERDAGEASPAVTSRVNRWRLHTNRGQRPDGTRQVTDPQAAPAPAVTGESGGQWKLERQVGGSLADERGTRGPDEPAFTVTGGGSGAGSGNGTGLQWRLRNNTSDNADVRGPDEPAPTLYFGARVNTASWVADRPATTVCADNRLGRPGHKDRDAGTFEAAFEIGAVQITVAEAAALQSFPPGYPWQGTRTRQFQQVGNAFPPLAAIAVLGEAAGLDWGPVAEKYRELLAVGPAAAEQDDIPERAGAGAA